MIETSYEKKKKSKENITSESHSSLLLCQYELSRLTHSLPLTRWRVSMALPPMPVMLWGDNRV